MKHKSVWVGVALLIPTGIHGATWVTPSCCSVNTIAPSTIKCKSVTRKVECGGNITIVDCRECKSGYRPYQAQKTVCSGALQQTITYQDCMQSVVVSCSVGEYQDGMLCAKCPDGGKSDIGATSITQCYKPKYENTFSDSTGSGVTGMDNNCYYTK